MSQSHSKKTPDDPRKAALRRELEVPVGFSGLIARSWDYYRKAFFQLFVLFGCIFVPLNLLLFASGIWGGGSLVSNGAVPSAGTIAIIGGYAFLVVLPAFLASFAIGISAVLVAARMVGEEMPLGAALKPVKGRTGDLLAGAIMATAIALLIRSFAGNLDVLGVPMVFYGPPIMVQALLIDGNSYRNAGMKARDLLEGNWLRVFGYLVTIALGIALATAFLTLLIPLLVYIGSTQKAPILPPSVVLLVGLIRGVSMALLFPLLAVATTVLYGDLRARARGLTTAKDKFIREGSRDAKQGRSTT